jgi:hypothetical protein
VVETATMNGEPAGAIAHGEQAEHEEVDPAKMGLPAGFTRERGSLDAACGALLRRQLQAVAGPEFGQDMGRPGRVGFQLLSQTADEDAQVLGSASASASIRSPKGRR